MTHAGSTVTQVCYRPSGASSFAVVFITVTCLMGCLTMGAHAQSSCSADGYRIVGQNWDALLKRGWQSRQECAHPERPLRLVAMPPGAADGTSSSAKTNTVNPVGAARSEIQGPLLVKAGDVIRLWMQNASVRIEMSGVVERSAHHGDQVIVQVTRHNDDGGLTVQRLTGTVSGVGEVEMER